jgi:phospholipid-binding lipoprotein MlaA
MQRLWRFAIATAAAGALAACASVPSPDPRDPWEPVNRALFDFNDAADRAVVRPVAEAYRLVLPEPIRIGIRNFYANLQDPWIALNQLLQGKVENALSDLWRFIANTTFGIAGIFDIATDMRLPKHSEDFGQTLAVWGFDFGPYLVLPFLGPSSVRDGLGLIPAGYMYLPYQLPKWLDVDHWAAWSNTLTAIDSVQTRADLLPATELLDQVALDRYAFVRNAYFQRRRNLIYDGHPPPLPPSDEEAPITPEPDKQSGIDPRAAPAWPPREAEARPQPRAVEPSVPAGDRTAAGEGSLEAVDRSFGSASHEATR